MERYWRDMKRKKKYWYEKERKNGTEINIRSGHKPSPEGASLLFAGTTSPMICPDDGPIEARHHKTEDKSIKVKRKERKENKRGQRQRAKKTKTKTKPAFVPSRREYVVGLASEVCMML